MFDHKRTNKLTELEVLDMLNSNLRDQVIAHLNGKLLSSADIFYEFDLRFLSEVTFLLDNEAFSMDDTVFTEQEHGETMYFITKGIMSMIHKASKTFVKDLSQGEYCGEIGFFSELPR